MCKERPSFCVQVTILLELRYRSPLEGNEESDEDLEDDEEEFVPNVGLVSHKKAKAIESDPETNALISLEENIAKLEQSILANNMNNASSSGNKGHKFFQGQSIPG